MDISAFKTETVLKDEALVKWEFKSLFLNLNIYFLESQLNIVLQINIT